MSTAVRVRTPCRLHFGMFGFGRVDRPQFGGVGAMIEPPSIEIDLSAAEHFAVHGVLGERVSKVVASLVERWQVPGPPGCEIVVRSPHDHTGLGVGTQLHLPIAAGLRRFLNLGDLAPEELSDAAGRGARSAVGTYGFHLGGLIVDAGKEAGQRLGKLATRVALPDGWRFVLFCRSDERGLAGAAETTTFQQLQSVPDEVTQQLWAIADREILPAVEQGDCARFGEAVYRFNRLAGGCFAAVQHGPFASEGTEQLVEEIRRFGVPGAGQSSWGPTVFAITNGDDEAERLIDWILNRDGTTAYDVTIARPNNHGATIEAVD